MLPGMRRTLVSAAALLVLTLAGCASSSSTPSGDSAPAPVAAVPATTAALPSPAQQLRDEDIAAGHGDDAAAYDSAFADLSAKCTEQGVPLANEMHATLGPLQKANINDETHLTVMQHVAASIPAGSPKMGCADIAAAYVTLREGGQAQ
jgi:hypothetical protein